MVGFEIDSMFSGSEAHVLKHDTLLPSSIIARWLFTIPKLDLFLLSYWFLLTEAILLN